MLSCTNNSDLLYFRLKASCAESCTTLPPHLFLSNLLFNPKLYIYIYIFMNIYELVVIIRKFVIVKICYAFNTKMTNMYIINDFTKEGFHFVLSKTVSNL